MVYRRAFELEPQNVICLASLSRAYYKLGRYADAAEKLSELLKRNPQHTEHRKARAECYMKLGLFSES